MLKQKSSPITSQAKQVSIVSGNQFAHVNPTFIMPVALFSEGVGLGWLFGDMTISYLQKRGIGEFFGYQDKFLFDRGVGNDGEGYWFVPFSEMQERGLSLQIATEGILRPRTGTMLSTELGEFIVRSIDCEWELYSTAGMDRLVKDLVGTATTGPVSNGHGYTIPVRVRTGQHILIP